jgi:hypothetical protein
MIIETISFLILVIAAGTGLVKIYEWRQDVLYGPPSSSIQIKLEIKVVRSGDRMQLVRFTILT